LYDERQAVDLRKKSLSMITGWAIIGERRRREAKDERRSTDCLSLTPRPLTPTLSPWHPLEAWFTIQEKGRRKNNFT
jgi:hypothetical protein